MPLCYQAPAAVDLRNKADFMPFSIVLAQEAELIFLIIDNASIERLFAHKRNEKYKRYLLKSLALELFGEDLAKMNGNPFRDEITKLISDRLSIWKCD